MLNEIRKHVQEIINGYQSSKPLDWNAYQLAAARTWAIPKSSIPVLQYMEYIHSICGLAAETGELVEACRDVRTSPDALSVKHFLDELGDVLYYAAMLDFILPSEQSFGDVEKYSFHLQETGQANPSLIGLLDFTIPPEQSIGDMEQYSSFLQQQSQEVIEELSIVASSLCGILDKAIIQGRPLDLRRELADIFEAIIQICILIDVDIMSLAAMNLAKLSDGHGWISRNELDF